MRGSLVVASLLSALTVTAAEQPKPVPAGTASISGRVIDTDTKRPLADAIITLASMSGSGVLTAITDAEGRYVLKAWGPTLSM